MEMANPLEARVLPAMSPTKVDAFFNNGWFIFKDKLFNT